jgi:hypothetical protein
MKRQLIAFLVLGALAAVGCGKKRNTRNEVVECSSISLDAKGTAQCLVQLYRWKIADAQQAATARVHELDSLKASREDSVWHLDAARHKRDFQTCSKSPDQLGNCLLVAGWPLHRVRASAESLWTANLPQHRRELETCMRKRDMNLSSCLTLYYKWDSDRALQTADSVARARLGGVPQRH